MQHDFCPLSEHCRKCGIARWLLVDVLLRMGLGSSLQGTICTSAAPGTRTR